MNVSLERVINGTGHVHPLAAEWGPVDIFRVFAAVTGLVLNGLSLAAYIREPGLLTSFSIYIIHLHVIYVAACTLQHPLAIIQNLYPLKWILSDAACKWLLLVRAMINCGCITTHAIMALNRTWAILSPVSYRHYSTKTFSYRVLLGLWIYGLLIAGVEWVLGALIYTQPIAVYGCADTIALTLPALGTSTAILTSVLPVVVVLVCCPVICIRLIIILNRRLLGRLKKQFGLNEFTGEVIPVDSTVISQTTKDTTAVKRNRDGGRLRSKRYLLLILTTASVAVCYLPVNVLFLCSLFVRDFAFRARALYSVGGILVSCQTILDPLLFMASMDDLRKAIRRTLMCGLSCMFKQCRCFS